MNDYVEVYSLVFSVLFGMIAAICQGYGIFQGSPLKVIGGATLLVAVPATIFAFTLPVVQRQPSTLDFRHVLMILYWATPVYGCQQAYFLIATKLFGWKHPQGALDVRQWAVAMVLFGAVPVIWICWA